MTKIARRSFFRLIAGAAAMAAVPRAAVHAAPQVIWCDGIHDDAPGLSALIHGEVVEFMRPEMADRIGWRDTFSRDTEYLSLDGDFFLKTPIRLEPFTGGHRMIKGGRFRVAPDLSNVFRISAPKSEHELTVLRDMTFARASGGPGPNQV